MDYGDFDNMNDDNDDEEDDGGSGDDDDDDDDASSKSNSEDDGDLENGMDADNQGECNNVYRLCGVSSDFERTFVSMAEDSFNT